MPLHDFECGVCHNIFEDLILNPKDIKNICCPKCGSKKNNKLISMFGIAGTEKKVGSGSCTNCSTKSCSTCK